MGDPYYADRAELAAFNSLPAMFTPDYWAHQYVTTANQPSAANFSKSPFYNTNAWSQTYGLEPHYPCCTVNHPQGWPKFLSNSFAKVSQNGIAHALLSPGTAKATLSSGKIMVEATTAYPFLDDIEYIVTAEGTADFYFRVPWWAGSESSITIDGVTSLVKPNPATGLHKVEVQSGRNSVSYRLQSSIRTERRANDTVAVYKGALLYAIEIKHTRKSTRPRIYQHPEERHSHDYAPAQSRDWIFANASAWNIAIDISTLRWHAPPIRHVAKLSHQIFSHKGNYGYMTAQGCEIDWPMLIDGLPADPLTGDARMCIGARVEVKLIPYGAAKTHMAEIPVIEL